MIKKMKKTYNKPVKKEPKTFVQIVHGSTIVCAISATVLSRLLERYAATWLI